MAEQTRIDLFIFVGVSKTSMRRNDRMIMMLYFGITGSLAYLHEIIISFSELHENINLYVILI